MTAARRSFTDQATACAALGAPFSARVLRHLAGLVDPGTALGTRILDWPGDPSARGDAVALRLLGGLHGLVLSGQEPGLARAYAAGGPTETDLAAALAQALRRHTDDLLPWLDSPPQTNEVRRSAVLIAAGHWLQARYGLPLVVSEVGASAGLNLLWDRYGLAAGGRRLGPTDAPFVLAPDWQGLPPPATAPRISAREGVDLRPLDPERDRLRVLSYIWAGQPERMALTTAALDLACRLRPVVRQRDARDWLAGRLSAPQPGRLHLVCHTVVWQYLSPAAQAAGDALIAAAGSRATPDAPLARFAMEADGGRGAALTLTLWPGGERIDCGRADFHGRWVDWHAAP